MRFQTAGDMLAELGRVRRDCEPGRRPRRRRHRVTPPWRPASGAAADGTSASSALAGLRRSGAGRGPGRRLLHLERDAHAGPDREGHDPRRRLRQLHRRSGVRRRVEASGVGAAAADAVPHAAARPTRAADASPDAARPRRRGDGRGRARGLPARRCEGDHRGIDRPVGLELRHCAGRAQLRDGCAARRAADPGRQQGDRPQGTRPGGHGHPRAHRRIARVDPEVRRPGDGRDDVVARGAPRVRTRRARQGHEERRGVDSVLPPGDRPGSEFRTGLRQARRRSRATSAASTTGRRSRSRRTSFGIASASTSGSTSTGITRRGCCRTRPRPARRSSG